MEIWAHFIAHGQLNANVGLKILEVGPYNYGYDPSSQSLGSEGEELGLAHEQLQTTVINVVDSFSNVYH